MTGIYIIKVNKAIVYVGKSTDVQERLRQHWRSMFDERDKPNGKYGYLYCVYKQHIPITFWLLEECPKEKLNEREKYWIQTLQPVLNSQYMKVSLDKRNLSTQEFFEIVFNQNDQIIERGEIKGVK